MKMIELEQHYRQVEIPKNQKKIQDFKEEIGNIGKCIRLRYLYDRLFEVESELNERYREYKEMQENDRPYDEKDLISRPIAGLLKQVDKFEMAIRCLVHCKEGGITPDMIIQARRYPIENLIEVKRGMALCPFHDDHHPSMGIKNNICHCFACGYRGDVIDVMMKLENLNFQQAIRRLQ